MCSSDLPNPWGRQFIFMDKYSGLLGDGDATLHEIMSVSFTCFKRCEIDDPRRDDDNIGVNDKKCLGMFNLFQIAV